MIISAAENPDRFAYREGTIIETAEKCRAYGLEYLAGESTLLQL